MYCPYKLSSNLQGLIDKEILSPHVHQRTEPVELLVLHKIALPLDRPCALFVSEFFQNPSFLQDSSSDFLQSLQSLKVSAHFVIDKDGKIIQCACPIRDVAWHCGHSVFQGREKCNEFSIGLEFIGFDYEDLTCEQYQKGKELIAVLRKFFQISEDQICGHAQIAGGRKTDPGFLEIKKLLKA